MAEAGRNHVDPPRRRALLTRLPTGAKVFLILSGALLPLALIALFATLQTTRVADQEARARQRVATVEAARALAIQLSGDVGSIRTAIDALTIDPTNTAVCARAAGVLAPFAASGARYGIVARDGRVLCDGGLPTDEPLSVGDDAIAASIVGNRGVLIELGGAGAQVRGGVFFPAALLADLSQPSGFVRDYATELVLGGDRLALRTLESIGPLARVDQEREALGIGGLELEMIVRSAPITSPLLVAMLLPLLMWAAAAGIAWFVVDRLLIRPLRRLRAQMSAYAPGSPLVLDPYRSVPAQEIATLGETFRDITRTVELHEAGLAEGLVRQTKLTREVHHRVKNNLQVIASLINFHARSATTVEAADAYASIQRRVDALAVVHRYHYAELEENRGLELRSVVGELASNVRATAPDESAKLGIALEIEPVLVSQDVAVAVAFLATELIELAMTVNPVSQIRIVVRTADVEAGAMTTAVLRVVSPSLVEGAELTELLDTRYGRVIQGLARQLRSKLHHDPLTGAYETDIPVIGRV